MGIVKGGALRLFQTLLYALALGCSAVALGIYSYFLAVLADRTRRIPTWEKAVAALSGAAALYTVFAVVLTCCLGGISAFAFVAIVLDVCFAGAMVAIAVMTRHGASSCSGIVNTPLGIGNSNSDSSGFGQTFGFADTGNATYQVRPRTACRLNTAVFAVSVIGIFLFLATAVMQVALVRHHKKEKRYGPSPSNNYTSGFGTRKFWQRKPKNGTARETEMAGGAGSLAAANPDMRPSYETGTTLGHEKVDPAIYASHPAAAHSGYYTQPTGTGVNPYGYDQRTATHTTASSNY